MMNKKRFFIVPIILCACMKLCAQSKAEVDFLRSVSPMYKTNNGFKLLSETAQPVSLAVPFGIIVSALLQNNEKLEIQGYSVAGSVAAAIVATGALKLIVDRPRPYEKYPDIYPDKIDNTSSFPSAHTSMAFATATSLALTYKKWYISIPCFAWAAGVGYSRMYLGQHYPSDVVAGAVIGVGSAYAARWISKKLFAKRKLEPRFEP